MKISIITTDHYRVPLIKRGRVSLTDSGSSKSPASVELLVVKLKTDSGFTGIGFTEAPIGVDVVAQLMDTEIAKLVVGESPHDVRKLFDKAENAFRNVGFAGFPARAYAAFDIALWDLKAKAVGLTLAQLLGNAKVAVPFFHSDFAGTGWDPSEVAKFAKPILKIGSMGVRVEVGGGDVRADADRVRELSEALGEETWLGVSAGGRYDLNTALALAHFFEDQGVDWFEDPIPASDLKGYSRLADRLELHLAVGAGFDRREDFYRIIRDGLARIVRPDPLRLGGITPLLAVAEVAAAYHIAVSPVRSTEIGVHLGCGLSSVPHTDCVGWYREIFTGGATASAGKLIPPTGPGLGIEIAETAAAFRV